MFVNSETELVSLNRKRNLLSKDTIVLIFSSMCGPCHMFLPTWKVFVNNLSKNKSVDAIAIEVGYLKGVKNKELSNMIEKMSKKNPYVPNVAKYDSKTKRVQMFKKDRSVEALNLFMKTTYKQNK